MTTDSSQTTSSTPNTDSPPDDSAQNGNKHRAQGRRKRKRGKQSDQTEPVSDNQAKKAETAALESKLREKEGLVAALTERLEQAAEQLDRNHRTGADRGLRVGGGLPPEVLQTQKTLVEDLQRAVEQWEGMQAAATLGRIEIQISELRDLFTGQTVPTPTQTQPNLSPEVPDEPSPILGDGEPSGWEKLKAELLDEDATATADETSSDAQEDSVASVAPESFVEEFEPREPLVPIDFESASEIELRQGIESRDEYISYLIQKLRQVDTPVRLPDDWQALENVPEQLRQRLEQLASQLDEKLRLAEVEHSLERARLGREEARLQQMEQEAQKTMKRLGIGSVDELEDGEYELEEAQNAGGRWLRMLGLGRTSSDEDDDDLDDDDE